MMVRIFMDIPLPVTSNIEIKAPEYAFLED